MAKVRDTKQKINKKPLSNFFDSLPAKTKYAIAVLLILIPVTFVFSPYLFDNMRPSGTDIVASKGETNLVTEWREKTGETPLWNTGIFSGMPLYQRITPELIHFDTLIGKLEGVTYWAYLYFLVGAFGIYSFLVYRKIPWYFSAIIAIGFTLLPDWQSLVGDGHFTKLRAIMVLPWLVLTFNYLIDKNSWFGAASFAFIFSWLIRTQHFQIVFYAILFLFFLFIFQYVKIFMDKEYKKGVGIFVKFVVAIILTVLTASQPFLSIKEYTPYSTRGGNPVVTETDHETAQQSGGVSFDYATNWSLAPAEVMDFFIQRFHGGVSAEIYDGKEYPQYVGKQVPGYWGDKPFSGNYAYMGMILFIFALIGVIKNRKDTFVFSLTVFTIFSLLLSFGKHFPELYKLFFYYVPYFSKFRAPAMMANITFIAVLILSGYGLKSFLSFEYPKDIKLAAGIFGSAIAFLAAVLFLKDGFTYQLASDAQNYDANTLSIVKNIRNEFLTADAIKQLWIVVGLTAASFLFIFRKIRTEVFVTLLLVLVLIELGTANSRAGDKIDLVKDADLETSIFRNTAITDYIKGQPQTDRAIVLGREFQSNLYSYFYPTINGYSAIKMQNIQDINDNCLFSAPTPDKINWNIINMLGGKYVILNQGVMMPNLKPLVTDGQNYLYENINSLPKAWFVKETKNSESPNLMLEIMNDTLFNPKNEALFVSGSGLENKIYNNSGEVKLISVSPNKLEFEIINDKEGFLVISEIFYPEGWNAVFNGKEIKIHSVNHILRGLVIPSGNGRLTMEFNPPTYYSGITMAWTGNIIILLMIVGFAIFENESLKNKIFKKNQEEK